MKAKSEKIILAIIIVTGFILRFIASISHSYSSDELSAITRLKYNSLADLLEFGVKTGDMHPAGVQLFMKFWTNIFGTSETALRFPFVILGTISIYLVYHIGKRFSSSVGLLAAAMWAVLLFPIIQSELARPYSPGLFFVLLAAIFLCRFIHDTLSKKQQIFNTIFLTLSIVGCMYTHYFAFLSVALMGLSSLFFIRKQNVLPVVISGVLAVLLFLPHLNITIYQVSVDGGIQWLSPPHKWWLFEFIFHAFNHSWLMITCLFSTIVLVLFSYLKYSHPKISTQSKVLSIWFFGTYALGHILSFTVTPILKFPVMVFVLPFLLLVISNFIQPILQKSKGVIAVSLVLVFLLSTTIEKQLFKNIHFEVFKELSEHIRAWEKDLGPGNYTLVTNISNPNYLNFYGKQSGDPFKFSLETINYGDAKVLDSVLDNAINEDLIIGYSGRHTPVQFFNQCLTYFPYIIDGYLYNNSAIYYLSKKPNKHKALKITSSYSLSKNPNLWKVPAGSFDKKQGVYLMDSSAVYLPQITIQTNKQLAKNHEFLKIELVADTDSLNQITLVAIPQDIDGNTINDLNGNEIWMGLDVEKELHENGKASFAFSLPPNMPNCGQVKMYVWNRNKRPFILKNTSIKSVKNIWNN